MLECCCLIGKGGGRGLQSSVYAGTGFVSERMSLPLSNRAGQTPLSLQGAWNWAWKEIFPLIGYFGAHLIGEVKDWHLQMFSGASLSTWKPQFKVKKQTRQEWRCSTWKFVCTAWQWMSGLNCFLIVCFYATIAFPCLFFSLCVCNVSGAMQLAVYICQMRTVVEQGSLLGEDLSRCDVAWLLILI